MSDDIPRRPHRHPTVDEGTEIMFAWAKHIGVDVMTTTLIVPPDFVSGFLAAKDGKNA